MLLSYSSYCYTELKEQKKMKRIHWLIVILIMTTTWLIYTIVTFDPTCHLPIPDHEQSNIIRPS